MNRHDFNHLIAASLSALMLRFRPLTAQVAVRGKTVYTMAGAPIEDGIIVIEDGKITAIGRAGQIAVPAGLPRARSRRSSRPA